MVEQINVGKAHRLNALAVEFNGRNFMRNRQPLDARVEQAQPVLRVMHFVCGSERQIGVLQAALAEGEADCLSARGAALQKIFEL